MQGGRSDELLIEDGESSIEDRQTNLRRQSGETFLLQPVFRNIHAMLKFNAGQDLCLILNIELRVI